MKALAYVMAATAVLTAAPLTVAADPVRMAQVDVDVRIGGPRGPGVVIDTDGRRNRDCRTVTVTEWSNGVKVTRTERRCD
jgi:hypothetical protein